MNNVISIQAEVRGLSALVEKAAASLAGARTSAEVLDSRDMASLVYDAAKRAARLAKAKEAHDDLIRAAHRAQADALEIEAQAKRRLADEYDAAQQRGEVAGHGGARKSNLPDEKVEAPTVTDLGLSHKDIHEARIIRDAERAQPGIVRRVLDERLAAGEEPTKAALRKAIQPERPAENVIPLGDRLQPVISEREAEKLAAAQEAHDEELEADDFDEADPVQRAAVVFQCIHIVSVTPVSAEQYWGRYKNEPAAGVYFEKAKRALEIIGNIVKGFEDVHPRQGKGSDLKKGAAHARGG
jgi:hypothetical protein